MKERGGLGGEGEGARTEIASPVDVVGWTKSKMPGGEELGQKTSSWNTRDLGWRVGADATAAACAGSLVAPIIYVIDRYVFEFVRCHTVRRLTDYVAVVLLRTHLE